MQWALVGGLGEAGAAALLALLCMAVVYLLRAIAATLPKINLGVVVLDLPKYFLAIVGPVVSWLVGATNELWGDAEWWMRNVSTAFDWMWSDVKNAFATDASFISHLFNTVIPDSASNVAKDVTTYVDNHVQSITRDVASAVDSLPKDITRDVAKTYAEAEALVKTTKTALQHAIGSAVTSAEDYADQKFGQAEALARGLVDALPAIPGELVAGIDYVTPAALAAVAAGVAAITTEFESCAVTSCDGPNNLQGLLNTALGLTSFAVFAEWIKSAIQDPSGAEATFASAAAGLYSDADSLLDSLLSL